MAAATVASSNHLRSQADSEDQRLLDLYYEDDDDDDDDDLMPSEAQEDVYAQMERIMEQEARSIRRRGNQNGPAHQQQPHFSGYDDDKAAPRDNRPHSVNRVCVYWQWIGYHCKYGDKCRFQHLPEHQNTTQRPVAPRVKMEQRQQQQQSASFDYYQHAPSNQIDVKRIRTLEEDVAQLRHTIEQQNSLLAHAQQQMSNIVNVSRPIHQLYVPMNQQLLQQPFHFSPPTQPFARNSNIQQRPRQQQSKSSAKKQRKRQREQAARLIQQQQQQNDQDDDDGDGVKEEEEMTDGFSAAAVASTHAYAVPSSAAYERPARKSTRQVAATTAASSSSPPISSRIRRKRKQGEVDDVTPIPVLTPMHTAASLTIQLASARRVHVETTLEKRLTRAEKKRLDEEMNKWRTKMEDGDE